MPLISGKLSKLDCQELVDKITSRVSAWAKKSLSYAGRIQLIKAIIFSIQVYWAGIFILPSSVITEIERIYRNLLWTDSINRGLAAVAWEDVCKPKEVGGL